MKKFWYIAITLIIVAIAAYYLHFNKSSTLSKRDTLFKVNEIGTIDHIIIESKNNSIDLLKEGENWTLKNERINQERLDNLLILAQKIEAVSPAAKSDASELKEELNKGTSVSFYSGRKLINSYRLCSSKMKIFGSRNKSEKIFQVEARGYPNIDLIKIFSADPLYWTNRKVINYSPEEITHIQMNYPDDPEKNFKLLVSSKGNYQISDKNNTDLSGSADQELISVYMHFFGNIPCFRIPGEEKSEITDLKDPFFILKVESKVQSGVELHAYRKLTSENKEFDKAEFYGKINGNEVVKLKYTDLDPVLLELKDFLKK